MPQEFEVSDLAAQEPELGEVLSRVAGEVLETMFFAEALAGDCEHGWLASAISANVCFDGSHCGDMLLSVSAEAADSIAPAFLGVDPAETTELLRGQVILELANILCGSVLSRLWPESKLALQTPELKAGEFHLEHALHRCFNMPEGMFAVWVRLSAKPAQA